MFSLVAVLTLGLGIGANTAIFSVVNAVLLRPLPYAEPEQLMAVGESDTRNPVTRGSMSYPNFFDWRAQNSTLENLASYYTTSIALSGIDTPVTLQSATVSANLFATLKANPELGRWFTAEEEKPNSQLAVIISHRLWQRQFGGDPNITSRTIKLNDRLFQVVGVMPAGFQFPIEADPVELWVPLAVDAIKSEDDDRPMTEQRGAHLFNAIGRLKPNVTREQAEADLGAIASNLEKQYPEDNTYHGAKVQPFHEDLVNNYREALLIILGAVGCVLLIACANVANLLLARATVRHKEIAVRTALGASRWQVIRQLLTESSMLAFAGGMTGLLLAWWGTEALVWIIPDNVPRLSEINIDWWVLGFTFLVSLVTGILFGLVPAVQATRVELTEAMKENARGTGSTSRQRSRMRSALVITEIAVALVLLVSAGLLLQSFRKLQTVQLGIDPHNVLTAGVDLPTTRYPKPEQTAEFYKRLTERLRALPGVENASAIMPLPLSGSQFRTGVNFEGRTYPQGEVPKTQFRVASLNYFNTMKVEMVSGRDFNEHDTDKSQYVAIVNETFVKKYFPDENPIGKRVKPGVSVSQETPWREIIGVVKDVRYNQTLSRELDAELYVPHAQCQFGFMGIAVRTTGEPRALAKALQAEVMAIDKDIPISDVKTLDQFLGTAIAQPRFNAVLLGMFGVLALVLTAIGLYSVIAYSVAQRTQEIGIRMALGAQTTDVLGMVLKQGLSLTGFGLLIGIVSAYYLTRLLGTMLYGVQPTDLMTFLWTSVILTGVALVACLVPARRAAKVDPMVALRYE
jgi:putative ABC transport system permease protein